MAKKQARPPGQVRDAILTFLRESKRPRSVKEIREELNKRLGGEVASSSIRSYLGANVGNKFRRVSHGKYEIVR